MSASREFFNFCRASSLSSLLNCQSPSMLGRGLASGFLGIAGGAGAFVELTSDGGAASGPGGACAFAAQAQTRHAPLTTTALPNCLIFVTFLWLELQDYPEWPSLATGRRFRLALWGTFLRFAFSCKGCLERLGESSVPTPAAAGKGRMASSGARQRGDPEAVSAFGLRTLFEPVLQISRPFEQPQSSEFAELLRPLTVVRFLLRKNRQERYARRLRRQRVINVIPDV